ncbi:MAG TPA: flagellar assembly peptidoglycan hydrolase FlgJ [Burkholderiales bacterium]|jgi:flagellar protein FlgJ|nr:flagellar assembly peptidoglycan hydrolase FlgJ [Burkholderiales bacterium]
MIKLPAGGDGAAAGFALDVSGLDALKRQAKTAPREALGKAATEFEALFVQRLLKSMRNALPQDGLLSSSTMRTYTAMYDQQLAQQLAGKGMGLADMLIGQLKGSLPQAVKPPAAVADRQAPRTAASASVLPASASASALPASTPPKNVFTEKPIIAHRTIAPAPAVPPLSQRAQAFIAAMRPHAEAASRATGIPAQFLLGQAGLETGWGRHQPRAADGSVSHNLFGIKAGSHWTGAVVDATTTEYVDGEKTRSVEKFRSYPSYTAAFEDFAKLVGGSPRYASVVKNAHSAWAYASGMQQAGYATDPRYAEKLAGAINAVQRQAQLAARAPIQVAPHFADNRLTDDADSDRYKGT